MCRPNPLPPNLVFIVFFLPQEIYSDMSNGHSIRNIYYGRQRWTRSPTFMMVKIRSLEYGDLQDQYLILIFPEKMSNPINFKQKTLLLRKLFFLHTFENIALFFNYLRILKKIDFPRDIFIFTVLCNLSNTTTHPISYTIVLLRGFSSESLQGY